MLTLKDCIDFSGLTDDQVGAIAEHEHMADIIAAEWASALTGTDEGCRLIREILADEVAVAHARHEADWESRCQHCLEEFDREHHFIH